jgi:hypothetical protein
MRLYEFSGSYALHLQMLPSRLSHRRFVEDFYLERSSIMFGHLKTVAVEDGMR